MRCKIASTSDSIVTKKLGGFISEDILKKVYKRYSFLQKENSIMIGDCIEADIYGAIHSGFDAILFNEHKKTIPENIKQVHHLLELKEHL